ncbi:DUF2635 domain-containing protein [Bradyrhizobium barranii subsp. apii]|uniref:DUF2635 domain-containing protein n=1 Tax=Bradyrhizobium barranii subsp. apii TaxID=2819348 RepID=A0A8T5VIL9_9BRAD|nr:DUF2635 domain-containing protein [Bradyrhizobium barranii]UPT88627.1 DUF2635 domain-containing protein [Bradyrhizobium barranii subsp. apii]
MAAVSKAPKKPRQPRLRKADAELDRHFKACEARWNEAKLKAENPISRRVKPPDGKKIAAGLRQLYELTGDPLFKQAVMALDAYGLADGRPRDSVNRLWMRNSDEWNSAPSFMAAVIVDAEDRTGKKMSKRAAAAKVVAALRLPGTSFERAVDILEEFYTDGMKGRFPQFESGEIGTIFVVPVDGREPEELRARYLPKEGKEVPNNLHWRSAIASGDVTARVKSWRKLPPNFGNS